MSMHSDHRSVAAGDGAAISRRLLLTSGAGAVAAYSLGAVPAWADRGAGAWIDQATIRRVFAQTAKSLTTPGAFMLVRAPGVELAASYGHRRAGPAARSHPRRSRSDRIGHEHVHRHRDPPGRPARRRAARGPGVALPFRRAERKAHHDRAAAVDAQRPRQLHTVVGAEPDDGHTTAARVPTRGPVADRVRRKAAPGSRRAVRVLQHEHDPARSDRRAAVRPRSSNTTCSARWA